MQLSSLFRVPLNIFVVVSLLTGVSSARDRVLTASAIMLGISSIMTGTFDCLPGGMLDLLTRPAGVIIVNGLDKRRVAETLGRPA